MEENNAINCEPEIKEVPFKKGFIGRDVYSIFYVRYVEFEVSCDIQIKVSRQLES